MLGNFFALFMWVSTNFYGLNHSGLNFEFFVYVNSISALFIYLFNFSEFFNLESEFVCLVFNVPVILNVGFNS